jgi:hypothetical protein
MTRRWVRLAVAATLGTLLVGCSPQASDFEKNAEELLEEQLAADPGGTWTATCSEPVDVAVDTTFSCRATDGEQERSFTGRITSRSNYVLTADTSTAVPSTSTG